MVSRLPQKIMSKRVSKVFSRKRFPSTYENVHYHFATTDYGSACEINLEFTIPDEEDFAAYMETVAPKEAFHVFLLMMRAIWNTLSEKLYELLLRRRSDERLRPGKVRMG